MKKRAKAPSEESRWESHGEDNSVRSRRLNTKVSRKPARVRHGKGSDQALVEKLEVGKGPRSGRFSRTASIEKGSNTRKRAA